MLNMSDAEKREVLAGIRLFVLDMDGTFYLGDRIIDGSLGFIERLEAAGRRFIFFTNNSSRTPGMYIEKLAGMGCRIGRDGIMTSGDVAIRYLDSFHRGKAVYLMGTEALRGDFRRNGIRLVEDAQPDLVVAAFDTELTYRKLELACRHIRGGAEFLATHPDINCPTETGFIPDCGSFCAAISASTGRKPLYFGKPFTGTLEMILSATGFEREEVAFVGDRLYTDVAAGVSNGATGILVLSGETGPDDVASSDIKPDAIFSHLGEMAAYI
ncbi:MAG: HAD-IIA family hydrolase [Clostridiales Family XIII bacterium]|jgi:HAD superfamily hydrolase (TIGR01450 family)|nr:HAD-IIA family hydrolase [Clostridiales Family XIII bacterium]